MLRKSLLVIGSLSMLFSQLVVADARVTVAHFAPFAKNIKDTSVSIALNGVDGVRLTPSASCPPAE